VATRVPIVIVCDDVQWADDASLDLLDELVPRLSEMPVLVVCGARPELYERRPLWGEGAAWHERIDLGPLPRRQVEEMIRDRLQRVPGLSAELTRMLAERAEGNPLTLVESLHLLVDAGVIEPHERAPWVVHAERLGALALPATVQGIVQARLDRLEVDARGLLARATVVGKTFWQGALDALVDRWRVDAAHDEAAPAPSVPTADLLAQLRARQLVRLRESSTFEGEREYVFAESAIQEVAYEMLSLKVRRPAHLAVAQWLEQRNAGAMLAPQLGLHFERGGDLRRAAAEYARAGRHAAALGQNQDAMRHFERARLIHDGATGDAEMGMEPTPSPDGPGSVRVAGWRERVTVRLELGDVMRRVGRLDEAAQGYEQARARILRGERRMGAELERHETNRWEARVDFRLALLHKVQGRADVALQRVKGAIRMAEEGGAEGETPAMYALLAFLHRRERDPEASWAAALEGLRASRRSRRRDERWHDDVGELLFGLGAALYAKGRMVAAERSYRQAARVLGESDSLQLLGVALNGVAAVRLARGDLPGAREIVRRSLRLKERGGDLHQIAVACANLADVELKMGHAAAALELARRSVRLGEQARAGSDLPAMHHNVAEAALATGDVAAALDAAEKALGLAEVAGRVYLGDIAMTMARACVAAGRRPELAPRAKSAADRLVVSLAQHFDATDLRERAAQCRAVLANLDEVGGRS
jgi:tetratricopeptide (TPR) repeat protein